MHELVTIQNGRPTTTSRLVAETFGKEHLNVLRDIRAILHHSDLNSEFSLCNFVQSTYKNSRGRQCPEYILTRDGFTLLVMGYTGPRAMQFKIDYINAFNKMEAAQQQPALPPAYEPLALPAPTDSAQLERLDRIIALLERQQQPAPPPTVSLALEPGEKPFKGNYDREKLRHYQLLTCSELAAYLRISKNRAGALLLSEGFPIVRVGSLVFADREKVDMWVSGQQAPETEQQQATGVMSYEERARLYGYNHPEKAQAPELSQRKLLTRLELAVYLRVNNQKAHDLLHSDGFPTVRIGRRIFADRAGVDEWLKQRTGSAEVKNGWL